MSRRRVVITGMGAVSPLGLGYEALMAGLQEGASGVSRYPELEAIDDMRCRVAGFVPAIDPKSIDRKYRRSMSEMSIFAVTAAREALNMANVNPDAAGGDLGVCIGSTLGSPKAMEEFFGPYLAENTLRHVKSTAFFKIMGHTCAANVAQYFGIKGSFAAPAAACATGCLAVGMGFETIAAGKQEMMLCGGAEEMHPLTVATFDIIGAASTRYNETPEKTPRPFDAHRDGMVCSEGSGVLLLESLDSALSRNARIYGEVLGFASLSAPTALSTPDDHSLQLCIQRALDDAHITASEIEYANLHATATELGDLSEAKAVHALFGEDIYVSSLKGHLGHSLAASGALELIATLGMMDNGVLTPTRNLEQIDSRCPKLRYLREPLSYPVRMALKNNFALGGVNATLIVRKYDD